MNHGQRQAAVSPGTQASTARAPGYQAPAAGWLASDPVHGVEDILVLDLDTEPQVEAEVFQVLGQFGKRNIGLGDLHQHHHGENLLHDRLGDIEDIDVGVGQDPADRGDDADPVFADDADDRSHKEPSLTRLFLSLADTTLQHLLSTFYHTCGFSSSRF